MESKLLKRVALGAEDIAWRIKNHFKQKQRMSSWKKGEISFEEATELMFYDAIRPSYKDRASKTPLMKEMHKTEALLSQWENLTEVERSQFFYVLPFVEQRVALMCVRQDAVKESPDRIEMFDKGMRFEGYSPNVENLARALYARGLELYEAGVLEPTSEAKEVAQKNRPKEKDKKTPE